MSGLAFQRARERVHEALIAGSLAVEHEAMNAHRVDGDQIVAVHSGAPAPAVNEWSGHLAVRGVIAIGDGADPVAMIAGLVTQALLTGFFMAEEISKDAER